MRAGRLARETDQAVALPFSLPPSPCGAFARLPAAVADAMPARSSASPPPFSIQVLSPADTARISEVAALVNLCYRGPGSWTGEAGIVRGTRITAAQLAEDLSDPVVQVLLAVGDGGELLGCVKTGRVTETVVGTLGDGPAAAYLGMLAVSPAVQSCGVGGRLVAEVERRAREELGCGRLVLDVLDCRTELLEWYGRLGFCAGGGWSEAKSFMERKGEVLLVECGFVLLDKRI
jgi:ribosomal protein S18 acetylase RimI-like enzyme